MMATNKSEEYDYPSEAQTAELVKLWKNEILCDVKIVVDDGHVWAHKIMLAAGIPYFNTLFTGKFEDCHKTELSLSGFTPRALTVCLEAVYVGKLNLDEECIFEVLPLANYLMMSYAVSCCGTFIIDHVLNTGNCISIWKQATRYKMNVLERHTKKFIFQNFVPASQTEEFLHITRSEIESIISSHELECEKEKDVLDAVVLWVKHDLVRQLELPGLLKNVRCGHDNFTQQDIVDAWKERVFVQSEECQDWLRNALQFKLLPAAERESEQGTFTEARGELCLISVFSKQPTADDVVTTSFTGISLERDSALFNFGTKDEFEYFAHDNASLLRVNNHIYILGGFELNGYRHSAVDPRDEATYYVCRYNFNTNKLEELAGMLTSRARHCGFAPDPNTIVVVCGVTGRFRETDMLSSVEVYKADENRWEQAEAFEEEFCDAAACSHQGFGYVSGGKDDSERGLVQMLRYTPAEGKWDRMSDMQLGRSSHTMCTLGNTIYVCGGLHEETEGTSENSTVIERYSVAHDQWTFVTTLPGLQVHFKREPLMFPIDDTSVVYTVRSREDATKAKFMVYDTVAKQILHQKTVDVHLLYDDKDEVIHGNVQVVMRVPYEMLNATKAYEDVTKYKGWH